MVSLALPLFLIMDPFGNLVPINTLSAFLGRRGAIALGRLVGMHLSALPVQMILDGIDAYLDSRMIG